MTRSANALRVPFTLLTTFSTATATLSMPARLGPNTLIPTALRTPVASISLRVWIGIHQMLGMPGKRMRRSMSLISRSHVMPLRHWLSGLRDTTVSTIESGAGSVGLVDRPALPNTVSTSGKARISWSCVCTLRLASSMLRFGNVVGM